MKEDIEIKWDKLSDEADVIVANPDDKETLRKMGFSLSSSPSKTIDELFQERSLSATEISKHFPPLPNNLPPAIQSLYQEIRECIIFGLNGAAITLSGNLVEFSLKHVTYIKEIGGYQDYDEEKWESFEKIELAEAIGRAKKTGLLSKEWAKRLNSFREEIRNPYSHYNIKKITEDAEAEGVKIINLSSGKIVEKNILAKEDPVVQAQAKPLVDKDLVFPVFNFTDTAIKYFFTELYKHLKRRGEEQASYSKPNSKKAPIRSR
ncbi:MAG: hypothetical protein D3914_15350 [Candidatus Electrothrix sp. LOE2]|nr:hypothetical protein [Candidatus Electrothrix sp. LOE2]